MNSISFRRNLLYSTRARLNTASFNNCFINNSMKRNFSTNTTNVNNATESSCSIKNMLYCTGILVKKSPNRTRPETFVGDLQEILRLGPNNMNIYFFTWSIACRIATALLCFLLV